MVRLPLRLDDVRVLAYLERPSELVTAADADEIMRKAIPLFFVLMALEFAYGLAVGRRLYRVNDALSSILLGGVQQQVYLWGKPLQLAAYAYVREHFRFKWTDEFFAPNSIATYVGLVILIDFFYYWFHRWSHEFHFAWAAHSVHHSGEDYNLATALRQGAFQWALSAVLYLPLALFFPLGPFLAHSAANLVFQFWFHNSVVGWLYALEYVINTPSSHRVHHRLAQGASPGMNCNYGGLLIVFDRMFGTYVPEGEQRDYYGLAKQYETFDPLWANAEHVYRVVHNIDPGKTSWWRALLRRRIAHPFVFRPLAVFERIPPPTASLWAIPEKPVREKLDPVVPVVVKAYAVALALAWLLMAVVVNGQVDDGVVARDEALMAFHAAFLATASCVGQLLTGVDHHPHIAVVNLGRAVVVALGVVGATSVGAAAPDYAHMVRVVAMVDVVAFAGLFVSGVVSSSSESAARGHRGEQKSE